jgi:hypothetical protein
MNKKITDEIYRKALKRMMNTDDGIIVSRYWLKENLQESIFNPQLTEGQIMYKLGRLEERKTLISEIKDLEQLEDIRLISSME